MVEMYRFILLVSFDVLGAVPFLPRGKGALILILGGLAALVLSLLWSVVAPRSHHRVAPRATGSRPKVRIAPRGLATRAAAARNAEQVHMDPGAFWVRTVMSTAAHAGLGRPALVESEPGRHTILLTDCCTCRNRRRGHGCERERGILERAMKSFAPRGRAVELACNTGRRGSCTFVLLPGVRPG